jgi:hypothetical protein
MKGFSSLLLGISGFVVGAPLVALTHHFIPGAPDWFPFLIIILVAGVVYAVGVLRWAAIGIIVGVLVFGAALSGIPLKLDFLPVDLRQVPAPF